MKNSKKLKLILIILICILIILVGIVGVYIKSSNMYKNILPGYTLASDINGITVLEFKPDDSKNTVYYDKEGNKVDNSTITEKNEKDYEKKEIPVNLEENLNADNYNISLNVMKKRLELLKADQYEINLDEKTGIISLSVEDDYMEDIESFLPMEGRLQLIDTNTQDVILDYTDFKSASATYASLTNEVVTYINLKLNTSGVDKINNIEKYKTVQNVKEGEEAKESTLKVVFDNEEIAQITYDKLLLTGKNLRITTADGLASDAQVNSTLNMNTMVSKLATIGKMPVIYKITAEEFIKNEVENNINYIIIILIAICVVLSLILIFKNKSKGLLAILGFVTNISIFLIVIRLTKIQISINGFAGMFGLVILNVLLINNMLKCIKDKDKVFSENVKNAYLKTLDAIVIMLIIFIVFAFSGMTVISSMGLLLFWGWLITVLGNLIFTVPMLAIVINK